MPFVLNANDLPTGDVVYWSGQGWTRDIAKAVLVEEAEADALGKAAIAARLVVDAYRVEVTVGNKGPWPTRYREKVRAAGPSVRPDLLKNMEPA
jgi:tartrate dehydratase beta subunit/fumarate hydratase class I family protein